MSTKYLYRLRRLRRLQNVDTIGVDDRRWLHYLTRQHELEHTSTTQALIDDLVRVYAVGAATERLTQ